MAVTAPPAPTATAASIGIGLPQSTESSLSSWAGPYVTEMLGRGQALASMPYQAYTGPLTAGQSPLQTQAFQGIAGLALPTADMTTYRPAEFTADTAQQYMNPYLMASLQPQIDEARRQAQIQQQQRRGELTRAGAYGGGRQAVMESEADRSLLTNLAGITGTGYKTAYDTARQQFETEQSRRMGAAGQAQQYGLAGLSAQTQAGAAQRAMEQEGTTAGMRQFEEQRDYPYKQVQYMQSLLEGLPVGAQSYTYSQPTTLSQTLTGAGGLADLYNRIFGEPAKPAPTTPAKPAPTTPAK